MWTILYTEVASLADTWHVSRLEVNIRYEQDIPVVETRGECDLITSRKLKDAIDNLISTGHYKIIFDFRDMSYIDSSGFRTLLDAKTRVAQHGGEIVLISLTAPVERVFELLGLGDLIIRTASLEEAITTLQAIDCH